jgi:hypothetical protein
MVSLNSLQRKYGQQRFSEIYVAVAESRNTPAANALLLAVSPDHATVMSADAVRSTSGLALKADIASKTFGVWFVPKADILPEEGRRLLFCGSDSGSCLTYGQTRLAIRAKPKLEALLRDFVMVDVAIDGKAKGCDGDGLKPATLLGSLRLTVRPCVRGSPRRSDQIAG